MRPPWRSHCCFFIGSFWFVFSFSCKVYVCKIPDHLSNGRFQLDAHGFGYNIGQAIPRYCKVQLNSLLKMLSFKCNSPNESTHFKRKTFFFPLWSLFSSVLDAHFFCNNMCIGSILSYCCDFRKNRDLLVSPKSQAFASYVVVGCSSSSYVASMTSV